MCSSETVLDAAVVGAGWAGLGVSCGLTQRGVSHQVLERARIAETWRTQRWDSFHINTPNSLTVMPGDRYLGSDADGAMSCREFVALLSDYAARHSLPVRQETPVTELSVDRDGLYSITVPKGILRSRNVVIASGDQNVPRRPPFSVTLPQHIHQMDASDYRNATALVTGAVLVVGGAQSGGQIAEDIAEQGREVYLATSRVGRLPRSYRGSHTADWMVRVGLIDVPREDIIMQQGGLYARPLQGARHTISLQSLSAQGVTLLGRFAGFANGVFNFAEDVDDNVRFADEGSATLRGKIDDFIKRNNINAPEAEPDPAEVVAPRLPHPRIASLDPDRVGITTVIWCTGFRGDFSWVRVPGVIDEHGTPIHKNGVAPVAGMYFAGLDFAVSRRSGTILAIDEEANRFGNLIYARCSSIQRGDAAIPNLARL